jgi:hypothetical protein
VTARPNSLRDHPRRPEPPVASLVPPRSSFPPSDVRSVPLTSLPRQSRSTNHPDLPNRWLTDHGLGKLTDLLQRRSAQALPRLTASWQKAFSGDAKIGFLTREPPARRRIRATCSSLRRLSARCRRSTRTQRWPVPGGPVRCADSHRGSPARFPSGSGPPQMWWTADHLGPHEL